ncbi:sulfite exporter TauE/SafE family protein [Leptospira gomenensis]|uniref:Sulfite exporter TauE/SafE family protein n=1 Tax=Leptospira gomenensis TaxID=2484974 RepID=A0A5F1YEY6_9LEPT|nr:sulfite exporter TauE/SafE family protein [Leptospira gomenensis]TGK40789.1 sulfite exporter TauE/SafE family protein [Leptospira gomenensis]TGK43015.1 sulfite exporter TauE/SafE family protein [Leptospira gomenensis]TGK54285.1 sulfite exporter TauE/SafE family protein [Leptospira gomenensis]
MQTEFLLTALSVAFLHGLTSSLHCLGMCGPFAGTLNIAGGNGTYVSNLLYNTGRLVSYSLLGAVIGFLGTGLNLAGKLVSLQQFAAVVSGIFVVLFGLGLIRKGSPESSGVYHKILNFFAGPLLVSIRSGKNVPSTALAFGMVTGLLPCAVLYPAFGLALAAADPAISALVMGVFFLGTFPALFLFGIGFRQLLLKLPRGIVRYGGIVVVLVGISMIFFRMNHSHENHDPSSHRSASEWNRSDSENAPHTNTNVPNGNGSPEELENSHDNHRHH